MEQIPVSEFGRFPYIGILTYPKPNLRSAKARIGQLKKLGVDTINFEGRTKIGRLGLVGIGTVGLVVKVEARGEIYALKIRRMDANRESMDREYRLTQMANRIGVGPRVEGWTRDFTLMQYAGGLEIEDWLRTIGGLGARGRVRDLVHALLNQCRKMDIINLDHGQLSNLRKHVVIAQGRPTIIDFESASLTRRPKNVTTAAQYVLVGGRVSTKIRRILGIGKVDPILEALAAYKRDMSDRNYAGVLRTLHTRVPKL